MFKGVIIFGAGLYTGVYLAQNYQIDHVHSPESMLRKMQQVINKGKSDE